ncbi:uncharacterized protein EV154DRAFT_423632 [Mucor mucedo]|uniref:uncharacterized protein n=1 Tax=Mucor mucedo TaxID=29922 RepID=UPI002220E9ED|nr:uncharacterized protein EV154DRAFT_423632 [Mucor mucedo]KAI7889602.1 hypothetical protein EV154DRAFT_423632 [Mucor mucedo]
MNDAPFPEGNIVEAVRTSCRAFVADSPVKVSGQGIELFLEKLDRLQYLELSNDVTIKMPLKFDTVHDEMNFITVIDLLNFGSGYRVPLHAMVDRGAFDTIRFGAMSFHIGGTPMDAETFKKMTVFQVAEIFQLPIDREVRHETLDFVTLTQPTELRPFADGLTSVINTTGEYLVEHGYKDLAQFIMDHVKTAPQDACSLVKHFAQHLPGLFDKYKFDDHVVYLYKKAQIIVYHLYLTFREQLPEYFDFKDIDQLTIFSDNVIPTLLTELGVLQIPESWQTQITANQDLSLQQATTLRAAAVVACDDIVMAAKTVGPISDMSTGALDVYLWRLAKEGDYRKIPRFQLKDTVMF